MSLDDERREEELAHWEITYGPFDSPDVDAWIAALPEWDIA